MTGLCRPNQTKGNNTAVYFRPDAAANQNGRDYERLFIKSFNPLYPPILGGLLKVGDTPKPPAKGPLPLCTPQLLNNPDHDGCGDKVLLV